VAGLDRILALAQQEVRLRETGQTSMFDMFGSEVDTPLPALELPVLVTPRQELLGWEKELLGAYMSDHPFKQAAVDLADHLTAQLSELGPELVGSEAVVAGTVTTIRRLSTRQGKTFAAFGLEDLGGTAELTLWPDGYERYRELLVEGTVVLARVSVRQRMDRVTFAVEELCGYDLDAGTPVGFDPARFKVRTRRRAPEPALAAGDGPGVEAAPPLEAGGRSHLRLVAGGAAPAPEPAPPRAAVRPPEELVGPRRLQIDLDETTDEPADRRRVRKIVAVLASAPGADPVELRVRTRSGAVQRLRLGTVALNEDVLRLVQGLLGVLGNAREVGDPSYGRVVAVAAGGG
jgi:DNA polymerase-3 subunit alpha